MIPRFSRKTEAGDPNINCCNLGTEKMFSMLLREHIKEENADTA